MIKIVTDSLAELTNEFVAEHGVTIMPSYVTFGVETLRDRLLSRERAREALMQRIIDAGRGRSDLQLGVAQAMCPDEANRLRDDLVKELHPDVVLMSEVGPAIGIYTGPGALGAFLFMPEQSR